MKKLLLIIFLGLVAPTLTFSQNPTTDELIDGFFAAYETGEPGAAIDLLYSSNSPEWLQRIEGSIEDVRTKFRRLKSIVGEYHGREKLTEESLGSSFKTIIFMVKYDRMPIRFTFQYYQPVDQWRLYGFSYDDDLVEDHQAHTRALLGKN